MNKRPANTLLAVVVGVVGVFALYILGSLLLDTRTDPDLEEEADPEVVIPMPNQGFLSAQIQGKGSIR